ncbi:PAS domain-containing protein [Methylobacterium sp. J-048]|uniref:PAS domain-containing protein n=1 Tax=Methylobacterium sp. J-048 TaxID=2836635 RepID=UPI001FB913A5|nr:PAS domain-containing protein [Methylobacterium sp. J-048]MCJ2057606.1 PAS domain-containing protein [Methylobacterium sp. J-048]
MLFLRQASICEVFGSISDDVCALLAWVQRYGYMTAFELIRAFAHDATVAIVVTDPMIEPPGPTILYANVGFGRLVGRELDDIVGLSPRFMQGNETRRETLETFHRALAAGERFHGYLTNYRGDGTKYRVEIDCRPLRAADGRIENFVSFEREVIRRLGRPAGSAAGRYETIGVSNDALTGALSALGVFKHT